MFSIAPSCSTSCYQPAVLQGHRGGDRGSRVAGRGPVDDATEDQLARIQDPSASLQVEDVESGQHRKLETKDAQHFAAQSHQRRRVHLPVA